MAEVVEPTAVARRGEGWTERVLAEAGDALPMDARRWVVEAGARTPEIASDGEAMLYVIRGGGAALVGGERLPLEPESVLWLDAGDRVSLEAGPDGLEVLQGSAPAG